MTTTFQAPDTRPDTERLSLDALQKDRPDLWQPTYWFPERTYSNLELTQERVKHLERIGTVVSSSLDRSMEHATRAVETLVGQRDGETQGEYAFVAPTRIERGSSIDYTEEGTSRYPLLSGLDQAAAQVFLASQPPFLIDHYGDNPKEPTGVMIFAPLFTDMLGDLDKDPELLLGNPVERIINPTIKLARDAYGVKVSGLAAVLPGLTKFGNLVNVEGIEIATGHAGTVWALEQAALEVMASGLGSVNAGTNELAIAGLGGIGLSTAIALRKRLPDLKLHVFDNKAKAVARAKEHLNGSVRYHESMFDLMHSTPLMISAITEQIDLSQMGNVEGHAIVDDSQPGSVPQEDFKERGGFVVGVYTDGGRLTRRNTFDYAGMCAVGRDETFSCHANVAAIAQLPPEERAPYCFRRPVQPEDVSSVEELFYRTGIKLAPLQWGWGGYHEVS